MCVCTSMFVIMLIYWKDLEIRCVILMCLEVRVCRVNTDGVLSQCLWLPLKKTLSHKPAWVAFQSFPFLYSTSKISQLAKCLGLDDFRPTRDLYPHMQREKKMQQQKCLNISFVHETPLRCYSNRLQMNNGIK